MTSSAGARFTLVNGGHGHAVELGSSGLTMVAHPFVDDQLVDEQKGMEKAIHLTGGDLTVVGLNWLDHVTEMLAVSLGAEPKHAAEDGIAFTPPPGSHAARMEELRRKHPELYAAGRQSAAGHGSRMNQDRPVGGEMGGANHGRRSDGDR